MRDEQMSLPKCCHLIGIDAVKALNNKRYDNQPNITQATKITNPPHVATEQAEMKR